MAGGSIELIGSLVTSMSITCLDVISHAGSYILQLLNIRQDLVSIGPLARSNLQLLL